MLCVFSSRHNCARIWTYIWQFIIYMHTYTHLNILGSYVQAMLYVVYVCVILKQSLLCLRWLQSMCNCTPEAPVLTLKCWDPGALHQNCPHFDLLR